MRSGIKDNKSLQYTIDHFKEVAGRNLFAENSKIEHDTSRCVVCNPEMCGEDAFPAYLEVIVESVLVRRPKLDEGLVAEMNGDLSLSGHEPNLTVERLLQRGPKALDSWAAWVREALAAGLGLLSIHSPTSLDFDLDEQDEIGHGKLIESSIRYIMDEQQKAVD